MKTLLFLLLLGPALLLASPLPVAAPTAAATDGDGTPWLILSGQLYRYKGKTWEQTPPPENPGRPFPTPLALAKMGDGRIACLWRLDEETATLTLHPANQSEPPHPFPLSLPDKAVHRLFCDPTGSLWITGDSPLLTRLMRLPQGGWKLWQHPLPTTAFAGPTFWKNGSNWKTGTTPIHATADGRGRVWLWANRAEGAANFATLRGALVFDDSPPLTPYPLQGATGKTLTFLAPRDEATLWAGFYNDGLYIVDAATGTLRPSTTDEAFHHIEALYLNGEDWLALVRQPGRRTLWRLRGEAGWQPLIDPVEPAHPDEAPPSPRATARLADGTFLLATAAEGLWAIPPGQEAPRRVDWRHGFPLHSVSHLLPQADGGLLAFGSGGTRYTGALPNEPERESRVSEVATRGNAWEPTPEGHLWALLAGHENAVSQWTGEKWLHHPLPKPWQATPVADLAWEADGRLWLLHDSKDHPTLIFTPATGQWEEHPTLEAAALARRDTPPKWTGRLDRPRLPAYSADGEITFLLNDHLLYHDGNRWRNDHRMSIARNSTSDIGAPYFDKDGHLAIPIGNECYVRNGKWWLNQRLDPDLQARYGPWREPNRPDTKGLRLPAHDGITQDNRGTLWLMTPEGPLIHQEGRSTPLFLAHELHPFRPTPQLREVWVDALGNAFFLTAGPHPRRYRVAPRNPPPSTQIAVRELGAGRIEISFDPGSSGIVTTRWQLDDAPEQTTRERTLHLVFFTSGTHRLRATSTNEEGYADAKPAEATFTVQADPEALWAALLADLQAPDHAVRKAAIATLARHPAEARPRLLAAREHAEGDFRWWLEAALTELDAAPRRVPPPRSDRGESPG